MTNFTCSFHPSFINLYELIPTTPLIRAIAGLNPTCSVPFHTLNALHFRRKAQTHRKQVWKGPGMLLSPISLPRSGPGTFSDGAATSSPARLSLHISTTPVK